MSFVMRKTIGRKKKREKIRNAATSAKNEKKTTVHKML